MAGATGLYVNLWLTAQSIQAIMCPRPVATGGRSEAIPF